MSPVQPVSDNDVDAQLLLFCKNSKTFRSPISAAWTPRLDTKCFVIFNCKSSAALASTYFLDTSMAIVEKQIAVIDLLVPASSVRFQTIVDHYGLKIWNRYLSTMKLCACSERPDFIGNIVESFRCFCLSNISHYLIPKNLSQFQDIVQCFKSAADCLVGDFHHLTNNLQIFIPSSAWASLPEFQWVLRNYFCVYR